MAEVKKKRDCYRLYNSGYFGNRALIWNSFDEVLKSTFKEPICIRGEGIPREDARYNLSQERAREEIEILAKKGYPEDILRFNQSMPDYALVIQGEVIDYVGGFELTYTTVKKPMNEGLREKTEYASGLVAKMLLQGTMDASSFSDLRALLEIYPDSAIEFSTYSVAVGDIPNRNTVFWEVRNY